MMNSLLLANSREKVQPLIDYIEMMSSNKSGREGMVKTFMTTKDILDIKRIEQFTEDSTTREVLNAYIRVLSFKLSFSDSKQTDDDVELDISSVTDSVDDVELE